MNNRHLFRAKRVDNGEFTEGCLMVDESRKGKFKYKIQPIEGHHLYAHPVCPSTICQCTGFKDKFNNHIFEKDIIKNKYGNIGIVRFGCIERHVGLYIEWISKESRNFRQDFGYWSYKVEVIGNIFDNPELLEQEEQHEK